MRPHPKHGKTWRKTGRTRPAAEPKHVPRADRTPTARQETRS